MAVLGRRGRRLSSWHPSPLLGRSACTAGASSSRPGTDSCPGAPPAPPWGCHQKLLLLEASPLCLWGGSRLEHGAGNAGPAGGGPLHVAACSAGRHAAQTEANPPFLPWRGPGLAEALELLCYRAATQRAACPLHQGSWSSQFKSKLAVAASLRARVCWCALMLNYMRKMNWACSLPCSGLSLGGRQLPCPRRCAHVDGAARGSAMPGCAGGGRDALSSGLADSSRQIWRMADEAQLWASLGVEAANAEQVEKEVIDQVARPATGGVMLSASLQSTRCHRSAPACQKHAHAHHAC